MPNQQKPASPQSVFRFVSVRAPRKLSAAAEEHGYCMYDTASPSTPVTLSVDCEAITFKVVNNLKAMTPVCKDFLPCALGLWVVFANPTAKSIFVNISYRFGSQR